jgi:hypothetical protein
MFNLEEIKKQNEIIKLYHYSNKKFDVISPSFFGDNDYTFNDKKYNIKRSFFYLEPKPLEYRFKGSKYLYIVEVYKQDLYDLREDKDNLKVKYKGDIEGLLRYCKRKYKGIIYNVGFDIVSLFYDIEPIERRY